MNIRIIFCLFLFSVCQLVNAMEDKVDNWPITLEELAKSGIDLSTHLNSNGQTLLMQAVVELDFELFDALLLRNVDLNVRDSQDKSALSYSLELNNICMAERLIAKGADKSVIKTHGEMWLINAINANDIGSVGFFLKNGVDPTSIRAGGVPLALYANFRGNIEIGNLLVAYTTVSRRAHQLLHAVKTQPLKDQRTSKAPLYCGRKQPDRAPSENSTIEFIEFSFLKDSFFKIADEINGLMKKSLEDNFNKIEQKDNGETIIWSFKNEHEHSFNITNLIYNELKTKRFSVKKVKRQSILEIEFSRKTREEISELNQSIFKIVKKYLDKESKKLPLQDITEASNNYYPCDGSITHNYASIKRSVVSKTKKSSPVIPLRKIRKK
jgi:ankyrin repeat protein